MNPGEMIFISGNNGARMTVTTNNIAKAIVWMEVT